MELGIRKKSVISSVLLTPMMDLCKQKLILKFAICMWQKHTTLSYKLSKSILR